MKNMKTFRLNLLAVLGLMLITACNNDVDEDFDTVAEIGDEAGMLVTVTATSNSSILGNPEPGVDLADAQVEITNAYLNMTVSLAAGSLDQIEKVQIVKSFNGGTEIVLGETTTLPYNLVIDNLGSLLEGTGVTEDELRIGDVLSFKTKITQTDGDVYYYNSALGNYSLTVNCSSDLAGTYTINYSVGPLPHYVTEIGPGLYEIHSMMAWPTQTYAVKFTDTCGVLELLNDWQFSNTLSGTGYVDADGNLVWTSVSVEGVYDGRTYTMVRQ